MKNCPYCGEKISDLAVKCDYCKSYVAKALNDNIKQTENNKLEEQSPKKSNIPWGIIIILGLILLLVLLVTQGTPDMVQAFIPLIVIVTAMILFLQSKKNQQSKENAIKAMNPQDLKYICKDCYTIAWPENYGKHESQKFVNSSNWFLDFAFGRKTSFWDASRNDMLAETSKKLTCPKCHGHMIPTDTPLAKEILKKINVPE